MDEELTPVAEEPEWMKEWFEKNKELVREELRDNIKYAFEQNYTVGPISLTVQRQENVVNVFWKLNDEKPAKYTACMRMREVSFSVQDAFDTFKVLSELKGNTGYKLDLNEGYTYFFTIIFAYDKPKTADRIIGAWNFHVGIPLSRERKALAKEKIALDVAEERALDKVERFMNMEDELDEVFEEGVARIKEKNLKPKEEKEKISRLKEKIESLKDELKM